MSLAFSYDHTMARRTTTVIDLATGAEKQIPFTVRLRVRFFVMRHARDTHNPVWKVLDDAFSHRYAARRRVRRMAGPRNWLMNVGTACICTSFGTAVAGMALAKAGDRIAGAALFASSLPLAVTGGIVGGIGDARRLGYRGALGG